jgi:flagellar biosynthesis/type III secretory pathway M-ring protein FliF/YscJ
MVLVALLAIFFVLRPLMKKLTQEGGDGTANAEARHALAGGAQEYALQSGKPAEEETIGKIRKAVKDNPQQVAMVLKGWIKEK